jgi:phosphate:Na+ symporter
VATIGFVNAGILTLAQAVGMVYGTNIGTTLTAWLVAGIGINIKIDVFALPLIGIGMLIRLGAKNAKRGAIGLIMVGFGLFFIGIDILKETFEGIAESTSFTQYVIVDLSGVFILIVLGFFMTLLTQSSSAAIAIVLTAVMGGFLSFPAAAAIVIGANIGTTSTALLAVIGSTPNAMRVATAHIFFNVITAIVALIMLPFLLDVVETTGTIFAFGNSPAINLAMFHTLFNVLGVLLLWPFTNYLTGYLSQRFLSDEEIEGKPRYLDNTVNVTPTLALNVLSLELMHIAEITRRMTKEAISSELAGGNKLSNDYGAIQRLVHEVEHFIGKVGGGSLPESIANELPRVLRCSQYFSAVAEFASLINAAQSKIHALGDEDLMADIAKFRSELVSLVGLSDVSNESFSLLDCEERLNNLNDHYHSLRDRLLIAGVHQRIKIRDMTFTSEQLTRMHRLSEQLMKATRIEAHLMKPKILS